MVTFFLDLFFHILPFHFGKDFENTYKKIWGKNLSKSENHEKNVFFKISQIINTIDFWCPPVSDLWKIETVFFRKSSCKVSSLILLSPPPPPPPSFF